MCGLAGILFTPEKRSRDDWQDIATAFTRNLLFNEERGYEASGVALVRTDGSIDYFKAPLPASSLIKTADYARVLSGMDEKTTMLLGHTRAPTKGSPYNNVNNHPLLVDHIIGVHNGHIYNDEGLTTSYELVREAQVDSEVIFRLMSQINPHLPPGDYLAAMQRQLSELVGKFTFLAVDRLHPEHLLVTKHLNPLSLHYHAPWHALIFSSRYLFLRKEFGYAVRTERLPAGRLFLFGAGELPKLKHMPLAELEILPSGT